MDKSLTPSDIGELARLESIIETDQAAFLRVGGALMTIRDRRLYLRDYDTFEGYCQKRWKFSASRASQLINATVAVQALPSKSVTIVTSEGQARALAKVPEKQRADVLETVQKAGPVTAKSITAVAARAVKPAEVLDSTGWPVPEPLREVWANRGEVEQLSREVAAIETRMVALQENRPQHWLGFSANEAVGLCQRLHQCIGNARSHAVCPTCAGRNFAKCAHCKGKGFLSKFLWDSTVPSEVKAIRAKARGK